MAHVVALGHVGLVDLRGVLKLGVVGGAGSLIALGGILARRTSSLST
jgi:hypothetical protein